MKRKIEKDLMFIIESEIRTDLLKTYYLAPEKSQLGCNGCDLLGKVCTKSLTDYCRQGYILKEVKL